MSTTLKATRRFREIIVKSDSMVIAENATSYGEVPTLDNPDAVALFFEVLKTAPEFRDGQENFVVIYLNTRRKYIGHAVVATGVLDQVLVHPRETFRGAVMANAHGVILAHNHPSGNSSPSESDIRLTRQLISAGKIMGIEVLDHVVVGTKSEVTRGFSSLRELGYFHA